VRATPLKKVACITVEECLPLGTILAITARNSVGEISKDFAADRRIEK
jgi:hypothetical protein